MRQISIRDSLFSHAKSSSGYHHPTWFEWNRNTQYGDFIFLTDSHIFDMNNIPTNIKKYAWLVESPIITTSAYDYVYDHSKEFDKIFTFSKKILENSSNSYFLPIGGCFLKNEEIRYTHEKTRLVSMMFSGKRFTYGQNLRHTIANMYSDCIDLMGSAFDHKKYEKIDSCGEYAFSVVIENCKKDYYFTEKIIDCFLTGTVPIYWGCPSIHKFFNPKGFITFDEIEELEKTVKNENYLVSFYKENAKHIIENFNIALNYKVAEDYLYKNYISNEIQPTL